MTNNDFEFDYVFNPYYVVNSVSPSTSQFGLFELNPIKSIIK